MGSAHIDAKTERVEQLLVDGREGLNRAAAVVFVERIVGALHAAVEEIDRIRVLAKVREFGDAAIDRELSCRCGAAAGKQIVSGAHKGAGACFLSQGVGELVQGGTDQITGGLCPDPDGAINRGCGRRDHAQRLLNRRGHVKADTPLTEDVFGSELTNV